MEFSLKLAVTIQIMALFAILLNIPILRQIIFFVYLSFLPGLLASKILKLDIKSLFGKISIAVGLSIAFSTFVGLLANELYPLLGFSEPLSLFSLYITFSVVILQLTLLAIVVQRRQIPSRKATICPSTKQFLAFLPLPFILISAILGAMYHNTQLLLLMTVTIAIVLLYGIISRKTLPQYFFSITILVISISLTFQSEFISQHVIGWDTFGELYVFSYTNTHSFWNHGLALSQSELRDYNGMLSITILPTVYSKLMDFSPEWVIKTIYFLLFSIVPLTIYEMFRKNFGKAIAFLSAFYFTAFPFFYDTVRRQIIGEIFLVLIVFTILGDNLSLRKKEILITIFGIALVVSHYSTFYVFLFCALASWVSLLLLNGIYKLKGKPAIRKVLTLRVLLAISAFAAFWYTSVSTSANQTFVSFLTRLTNGFTSDFSILSSRGNTVSDFVSPSFNAVTLTYQADYFLSKIPYLLIFLGVLILIKNRKKLNLQAEYLPLALSAILLLVMTFVLPALGDSFVEERFFQLLLLFFAPICFYGGAVFFRAFFSHFMKKTHARSMALVLCCILILTVFFFKVGFSYQLTGDTGPGASTSFSFTQMALSQNPNVLNSLYSNYVPMSDIYGATWLSLNLPKNTTLYADADSRQHVIRGYGLLEMEPNNILSNYTRIDANSYTYYRLFNLKGFYVDAYGHLLNMSRISDQLTDSDIIYSNGECKIFYQPEG
jgi:uncharacterized membrane protein